MLFSVCIVQCVYCCVCHVVCSVQSSVFHIIKAPLSNWSFWMFKLTVFGRFFGNWANRMVQIISDSPSI